MTTTTKIYASTISRLFATKSRYTASKQVRGYGWHSSGYEIKQRGSHHVIVGYHIPWSASSNFQAHQIMIDSKLIQAEQILQAKGYVVTRKTRPDTGQLCELSITK